MDKIGLIYSFNTRRTSQAAEKLAQELGNSIEKLNAETITEEQLLSFKNLIIGVPTWFDGELPNYWDEFVPALEDLDLKGKNIAIFGNGDQKGYPENFVDGIGIMAKIFESRGAKIIGFTPVKGYQFETSQAVRGDQFTGLALDFENQSSQVAPKIKKWVEQLKKEFEEN
ncbi:MAG TPA: flavodoxin [Bacteroidales bacterium]|jgi:flavodoxin I|nr:flavodoxin [Bacteroidales bacterium]